MRKIENPDEGAYGYSVSSLRGLPKPKPKVQTETQSIGRASSSRGQVQNSKCQCPMCYHNVKNPCPDCGCPDKNSTVGNMLHANVKQRGLAFTDHQTTADFFSPTSDYHSLSPGSPPPNDIQPSHSPSENQYHNSPSDIQPIYAKVNKNKTSEGSEIPSSSPPSSMQCKDAESSIKSKSKSTLNQTDKKTNPVSFKQETTRSPNQRPSVPERQPRVKTDNAGRRHSWAGDKGPGLQKQTSLYDFKKLLAQKSMGQNPHRISAKELLDSSKSDIEKIELENSSHKTGSGGSLRKKSSPWKDKRFSVIQEEPEGGSRENLLSNKL